MRNSLHLIVLASALSLTAGTMAAQTTRTRPTPPTQEELQARREQMKAQLEARKAQTQVRVEQTREQAEARREAAKAAAEARREAAKTAGETRPTRPERPAVRPEANDARRTAMREYSELRRSLQAEVKAGALDRAAAEARLKAWRESHRPGGGN